MTVGVDDGHGVGGKSGHEDLSSSRAGSVASRGRWRMGYPQRASHITDRLPRQISTRARRVDEAHLQRLGRAVPPAAQGVDTLQSGLWIDPTHGGSVNQTRMCFIDSVTRDPQLPGWRADWANRGHESGTTTKT